MLERTNLCVTEVQFDGTCWGRCATIRIILPVQVGTTPSATGDIQQENKLKNHEVDPVETTMCYPTETRVSFRNLVESRKISSHSEVNFKKNHKDKSIADEDKIRYLLLSVSPRSKAERLVLNFPATVACYPKAIEQFKERFGRVDLQV
ncbi:hypothetical protein NPIL_137351 [Nephila pilipes]|uniref:Uncharacterized protein n=1 Tax=Nephila pilipes TaxID=299642 RepID=A0A8X6TZX3_NEPPI|nr:hypothetical protein NPIL_137351 [Nephila pilipes]